MLRGGVKEWLLVACASSIGLILYVVVMIAVLAGTPNPGLDAAIANSVTPTSVEAQDGEMLNPYFINNDLVVQVRCGGSTGTAAWIDRNTLITAQHVTRNGACSIKGQAAATVYEEARLDFAVLRSASDAPERMRMAVSCAGFKDGARYFGVGFALGRHFVTQPFTGTRYFETRRRRDAFAGMSMLRGYSFRGMSGGPVVDESGNIVGIVNGGLQDGRGVMLSRSMRETYLCGAARQA